MRRFILSLSLRTHLLLITFLLAAPAVIFIFISGNEQRRESIREALQESRTLVDNIATEQYNLTGDLEQLLIVLAQIPEIREHKTDTASRIMARILEKSPHFANIIITDRHGEVWASALPLTEPFSIGDKRSFRNTVASRRFSSGEYNVGKISAKTTIGFGYPVLKENGQIDGVISANFNFDHFKKNNPDTGLPKGSFYNIMDHNGIIIDTSLDPARYKGTKIDDETFLRMNNGPDNDSVIIDSPRAKGRRILSYRKLRLLGEHSPYLYIQAGSPLNTVLADATHAQLYHIGMLSLLLLLSILLAIFVGNTTFVDRIRLLQEASRCVADGNLDVRVAARIGGGELGALGQAFDDMAEQINRRETALIGSRQELDDLYNNAPCGYYSLDRNGMFIRINNTQLDWLGYTRNEVVGKMHITDVITPPGRATLAKNYPILRERGSVKDLEFDLVRKDGSQLHVLVNASGLFGWDGSFLLIRNTAFDITDRIKAEKIIHDLNQTLTRRVEEETERRLQHERLLARHARLAAMGEMIGAIAHQWRQPLTSIWATFQTIRMAWERRCINDEFLVNAEADTHKQITYMSDTIEDFRNFFSPDKIYERFDIKEKLQEVAQLVAVQFANSGVTIKVADNAPSMQLMVRGFQNEFKQSVLNLVSNAFDAIIEKKEQGDAADNEHEYAGCVILAVAHAPDTIIIEVRDNGCGIPPEYADKIFDPYFTSKSEGKGTGIGLYMSKLIVEESLGGKLRFDSSPAGTVFRIELAEDNFAEGDDHG